MCLLTNERYKKYQTGFSFGGLGHAPEVELLGTMGDWWGQKVFFSEIQPDLVCELHDWHKQQHNFLDPMPPWALGRGQKVKYH